MPTFFFKRWFQMKAFLGTVAIIFVFILYLGAIAEKNKQSEDSSPSTEKAAEEMSLPGEECVLRFGVKSVYLARSLQDHKEFVRFMGAQNGRAADEMITKGKVLVVPNETRADYLDSGFGWGLVRIIAGDFAGAEGYVMSGSIHKR
jgi:hypothetical protein